MTNIVLTKIDDQINAMYDAIKALDNDYVIETYTPEVQALRGKTQYNILPRSTNNRFPTAQRDMINMLIDVFMHYDMEADDEYKTEWTKFMVKAQAVLVALYNKSNFIVGVSTVDINVDFGNSIIEQERIISLTFKCEYKMFATR